ncbi:MAG: GTP pyrophosphokinase family protein [Eubacterium sp.]|nr:GTP pyrophosphokinase family protein [Eubacterium sp.]
MSRYTGGKGPLSGILNMNLDWFLDNLKETTAPVEKFFANYRCAIMEIETKFNVLDEQFSIKYDANPIESIHTRVKDYDSIIKKCERKNIPFTLTDIEENIFDIAGVRVICSFESDIYRLADLLIQQDDITLIEKKDYIANPKENGYRSLHLIVEVPIFIEDEKKMVKVEVQLRTIAMDFWASLEHKMRYKKNIAPEKLAEISSELTQCAHLSASLDERMQAVRDRILEG